MMSVLSDRAVIKKEELWDVVGMNQYRINNRLDDKYEPRPAHVIQREAHRLLGREVPFCVFQGNCEHFATELRYGKAESRQVRLGGGEQVCFLFAERSFFLVMLAGDQICKH